MADEFERHEVASIYVDSHERFVVSLVVGYDPERDQVKTPAQAAKAALELTRDMGAGGTHWYVYDRVERRGEFLEQSDFEEETIE